MRITNHQIEIIRHVVREHAGDNAIVSLFGSRLDDNAKGGDVDLLVQLSEKVDNPALLASQISSRISREMQGRKVDVLLMAPNLKQLPIHNVALEQGKQL